MVFHSKLDVGRGDGLIIGGSSLQHLQQNLHFVADQNAESGKLPPLVVNAFEEAWLITKVVCPLYYR